jgi:uncharacterized protein (DUF488 family)
MRGVIYTIGHSTRTLEHFVEILRAHEIGEIADVRTVPRSRRNPQFNRDTLPQSLAPYDVLYRHMAGLGGLRHAQPDSPNTGWDTPGFRAYADYMQTRQFDAALEELAAINDAAPHRLAYMCAESLWWQCHRRLISDALLIRGFDVLHIMNNGKPHPHELTSFAVVRNGKLLYPRQDLFTPPL